MNIRIKKTHPSARMPFRAKPGDSGLDLHALLPDGATMLWPGCPQRIRTGVAIELPEGGYEAQVRPRSGWSAKGIYCALGTIDSGYRGEIEVTLVNLGAQSFTVKEGDRIAQLVVCPVFYPDVIEVDELSKTERGTDGFGSTGR